MNKSLSILKKKSLMVCGGTYEDRKKLITEAIRVFSTGRVKNVYTLGEGLKTYDKYLKSARREFPMTSPSRPHISKAEMNYYELEDYQLLWSEEIKNVLVIIPELDKLLHTKLDYFYQILGIYLGQNFLDNSFRFLVTLAEPIALDYKLIPKLVGGVSPSEKNLGIVNLS